VLPLCETYLNCICFAYFRRSIGDNRVGGWYSYRASKLALNMLVKTAAIKVARTQTQAVLVALPPGTVNSALSAPFNGAEIARPAADAAGGFVPGA
jgi:NAD(P)-dependent dehydrogenase (short-subunit alcohol dehydrogenase family)